MLIQPFQLWFLGQQTTKDHFHYFFQQIYEKNAHVGTAEVGAGFGLGSVFSTITARSARPTGPPWEQRDERLELWWPSFGFKAVPG